ncbi:MAG: SHOCT domain-containing protein [Candidatus Latescibacter sp.]|nr:SHOCT domain-containing protein [Candidatus Latescibacter sp.]
MWGCMHGFGWGGLFMGFFMLVFWIVIIGAAYVIIRNISHKGGGIISSETPLDILKKRYARGEISKEEFEQMKRDLMS